MQDYTQDVMDGKLEAALSSWEKQEAEAAVTYDHDITAADLRRRPDIKKAIMGGFDLKEDELDEGKLLELINQDPYTRTLLVECLYEFTDALEAEGEPMYRPSILDSTHVDDIVEAMTVIGCREDHGEVPAKYDHLSERHQDMIYQHPDARKILSRMPQGSITESIVERMCSVPKSESGPRSESGSR